MHISITGMIFLAIASFFVGVSKTALPGLTTVSVAIFVAVLPAKESTAALLILLLVGDIFALYAWRQFADWSVLRKLLIGVFAGVGCGALFLAVVPEVVLRRGIGALLICLVLLTICLKYYRPDQTSHHCTSPRARWFYGSLAGFTTMTANSGGPVMSLYFIASGYHIAEFLGTQAWFFFLVNMMKLPFTLGLGLLRGPTLSILPYLVPFVIIGSLVGTKSIKYFSQQTFDHSIIFLTLVSSAYLLW
ncbi:sulfite exporter TauE/SafE family protein [Arcanobacterium phocae]|uniref:Probable membrane transporter protein n=2 Tax=Arcanobacterium phocae TaxID=131112 RepID=A0A1H2LBU8_9ACTO|nr:sulfite exporter TauE/SafE family protein [Arcanobacterium phocae]SDU78284.1 hypothetical protein SAMN04489737_0407 [Arcanobacterium phocae]